MASTKDILLMIDGKLLERAFKLSINKFIKKCLNYDTICFTRCTPA